MKSTSATTWKKPLLSWFLATVVATSNSSETSQRSTTTRIAFGSCHKNHLAAKPSIWERIVSHGPDAFVWTGDAMYPSSRDPLTGRKRYGPALPEELQQGLEELKTNETIGYTRLLAKQIPVYGVWDDHDYGGNDMGKYMPSRQERQDVYWNFLGYRAHPHDGLYHSRDIIHDSGHIKLILLDTRWFRDNHCIPSVAHTLPMGNAMACATRWATAGLYLGKLGGCESAELLGQDQWQWLRQELLTSKADLNIIVSSIQVWTTNPAMESWGQFPNEQTKLWKLLQEYYSSSQGSVMFWSGDVHHAELSGKPGYLEVTSSGLTHHCGQPKLYGRLCRPILETFHEHRHSPNEFYIGLNFGLLEVDWETRVATMEIKNHRGETVLSIQQPLDIANVRLPPYEELPHTWNGHLIPLLWQLLLSLLVVMVMARWFFNRGKAVAAR